MECLDYVCSLALRTLDLKFCKCTILRSKCKVIVQKLHKFFLQNNKFLYSFTGIISTSTRLSQDPVLIICSILLQRGFVFRFVYRYMKCPQTCRNTGRNDLDTIITRMYETFSFQVTECFISLVL